MRGLIIDIEFKPPDKSRYSELKEGIISAAELIKGLDPSDEIVLDYVHFSSFEDHEPHLPNYDFAVLSPQGCPWNSYQGTAIKKLSFLAASVRENIQLNRVPVLGICGGHQFLAMAFGGEVGFIDNRFRSAMGSSYSKDCKAERGETILRTTMEDLIFRGVAHHPGKFCVIENHVEEVKVIPPAFVNLAFSELSRFQLIRIPGKVVYGTAFHPERGWNHAESSEQSPAPAGKMILANFLEMACAMRADTRLN
ncbi:MAG: type 1 glutamine amidotransferase [Desulfomonilaceae bacterium]